MIWLQIAPDVQGAAKSLMMKATTGRRIVKNVPGAARHVKIITPGKMIVRNAQNAVKSEAMGTG
jgi:hypothetical protein